MMAECAGLIVSLIWSQTFVFRRREALAVFLFIGCLRKMGASVGGTPILRRQPMSYASGSHTVFHHRYHIVWITGYRYKVLEGALRERIRTIIRQVCKAGLSSRSDSTSAAA